MAKEHRAVQDLLNHARGRRDTYAAGATEREWADKRWREALVEEIRRDPVYRQTLEVMNDPVLDELVRLFWRAWKPIEMVLEEQAVGVPVAKIEAVTLPRWLRRLGSDVKEDVEVERPVPFPGLEKTGPLDPVEFMRTYPAERAGEAGVRINPRIAYLQSIGLTRIEDELGKMFPSDWIHARGAGGIVVASHDSNSLARETFALNLGHIRDDCPSFGGGHCGVIELRTPAPPERIGDQGKLRIRAGYNLPLERFLVRLEVRQPDMIDFFTSLDALKYRLAEILVEKGVSSVEEE